MGRIWLYCIFLQVEGLWKAVEFRGAGEERERKKMKERGRGTRRGMGEKKSGGGRRERTLNSHDRIMNPRVKYLV